ncbi:MAG: tetratricopeptide repeat-containing sensor histidine kinase [Flavipsychrobacter sp.]
MQPSSHAQEKGVRINELNTRPNKNIKADTASISSFIKQAIKLKDTLPDSAINILQNTLSVSRDMHYEHGIARSLNVLGLCYTKEEKYDQAISILEEALQHIPDTGNSRLSFEIYNNLSALYNVKGDYLTGVNLMYKAIDEAAKHGIKDPFSIANVYCNLGGELLNIGENDKAIYYLQKAQPLAVQINDLALQARILQDIAGAYYQKENVDSALPLFLRSLDLSVKAGKIDVQKTILQNIGKLYIKKHEPRKGIDYLNKALAINNNSVTDDIFIYYDLGNAYYQLKNYAKAETILLSVEKLAEQNNVKSHLTDAYLTLAKIYAETGRYRQAYEQQLAYSNLYSSVLNEMSAHQFSEQETKFQTTEKDKELAQKRLLLSLKDNRLQRQRILIFSILIILLLLISLLFILLRNSRHKRRIEQLKAVMEGEEKERKRIARDLHDGISQTISAAKINLMAIEKEILFRSGEQKNKFDKIVGMVDESFKEVRTISHNMMPNALLESGLALVIKQFVDNIDRDVIKINLYTQGLEQHFDSTTEIILYRVVQECVSNVIKHAGATQLDISLIKDEDGLRATIEDNGGGFDTNKLNKFTGIGLRNIQSRIALLNGKIEFDSSLENGTLVSIFIPAA